MPEKFIASDSILVLGAGELGISVLRELAQLRGRGTVPPVSVLLRPSAGASEPSPAAVSARSLGLEIVAADLATSTVDELAAAFSGFTRIVSCTGFVGGPGTQRKITQAVIAARVAHYVPWQFGVDYDVVGRGSGQEVWDEQLDVRDLLRAQSTTQWTIVSTGMFTSFVFLPAFGLVDLKRNRAHALGSWDFRLTVTTPEDIGRLTALVVADPMTFANQVVYVAGDTLTYSDLADTVDRVLGTTLDRVLLTMDELRAEVARRPDDVMAKYRLAFARPHGVAWPKGDTFNARLGLATVDVATWLRRWRDFDGAPTSEWAADVVSDEAAVCMARAEQSVLSPEAQSQAIAATTQRYYGSWNNGSQALFAATVSPDYVDHTPPEGRPPGSEGLADAQRKFRESFPNGRVHVLQQVVAGDRVVSHLRITGRFTGISAGVAGLGQRIDYLATDVMRMRDGKIIENWHVEDHMTLHRQLDRDRDDGSPRAGKEMSGLAADRS